MSKDMSKVIIRPANGQDFYEVYGHSPARNMKAYAAELDGKTIAVGGLYYFPEQIIAFTKIKEGYENQKVGLAKGCLKLMEMLKRINIPVFAVADPDIEGSEDLLLRCGFEYVKRCDQGEVYVWQVQQQQQP
jgi:hypothetical protein